MRQRLRFGKANAIAKKHGIPFVCGAQTRGNTGHRVDLFLPDYTIVCVWPDGDKRVSPIGWRR